jgi:hypothetical protein
MVQGVSTNKCAHSLEDKMEAFLATVGVAALTGLTYLAYRHPNAFGKLALPLIISIFIVIVGNAVWDVALDATYNALQGFIPPEKTAAARAVTAAKHVAFWVTPGLLVLTLYLIFLQSLPRLLKDDAPRPHA